jgi:hypothetical protein
MKNWLVNTKVTKIQHQVLTEEKLDDIGAWLEHLLCKHLVQEMVTKEEIMRMVQNYCNYGLTNYSCALFTAMWSNMQN